METTMRRDRQAGQALYVTAVSLVVLMGFLGLGIDMGALRYEKRLQQTAADAAALAGANNIGHGGITVGAQNASAADGFADNGGGQVSSCGSSAAVGTICVQINNPPASGPHSGNPNYVEALVSAVHSTYFMRIFGVTKETVSARAVATNLSGGSNSGCLYTLGPPTNSIQGVAVTGSAVLNAPNCGIVDNGNYDPTGGALTVTADTFGVSGDCSGSGCGKGGETCTATPSSCPTYGMPAVSDPLSYLTPPCSPCGGGTAIDISGNGTFVENPGTYSSISITGTGNGKTPSVTFNPGVYVVNGGNFTLKGNATISGSGVTFYFTNGATIDATGGGNRLDFNLSPPTSGQYAGILFYQDPNDHSGPQLGGDNNSQFKGALYFPGAQLTFFGNSVNYTTGIVVAEAVALSGNPTVNLLGTAGLPPGVNIVTVATLVE
jgi:Putative Flp pilus-assembly TadE/G-like